MKRSKSIQDIIGWIYIDTKGRNKNNRKGNVSKSSQKYYSVSDYTAMVRSELVLEFVRCYVKYGLNPTVAASHFNGNATKILPAGFEEYLKNASAGIHTKSTFNALLDDIKEFQTHPSRGDKRVRNDLGASFSWVRSDKPYNLESAYILLTFGTLRVREVCDALQKTNNDATAVAKLELGHITFQEECDRPLSDPFKTTTDTTGSAAEEQSSAYFNGPKARTLTNVCAALFEAKPYDGQIVLGVQSYFPEKKKGSTKRSAKTKTKSNKKQKTDVNSSAGQTKNVETNGVVDKEVARNSTDPEVITNVGSSIEESAGDDAEDMKFIHEKMVEAGLDVTALDSERETKFMNQMRQYFSTVAVDCEDDYGDEQVHYNTHLAGMILGKCPTDTRNMSKMMQWAFQNAKGRVDNPTKDDTTGKGWKTKERTNFKTWTTYCEDDSKSVEEKIQRFAYLFQVRVTLIRALGDNWTTFKFGEENETELPPLTILAKTNEDALQNDQSTKYEYYVPEKQEN